jgi:hypothetical protein
MFDLRSNDLAAAETADGGAYMWLRAGNGPRGAARRRTMIRKMRVAAAFAFGAGLAAAGVAPAQTQTGSAAPQTASAQPAPPPPPAQSPPPWVQPEAPAIKPSDPNAGQPTYSVDPPPEGASGIYLPAAVLGYAKSTAGCVVIGCDDGPQVGGSAGPSSSGSAEPPPANPATSGPH